MMNLAQGNAVGYVIVSEMLNGLDMAGIYVRRQTKVNFSLVGVSC